MSDCVYVIIVLRVFHNPIKRIRNFKNFMNFISEFLHKISCNYISIQSNHFFNYLLYFLWGINKSLSLSDIISLIFISNISKLWYDFCHSDPFQPCRWMICTTYWILHGISINSWPNFFFFDWIKSIHCINWILYLCSIDNYPS